MLAHSIPMTMQVQIQHKGGGDVSLDDCALFSKPMSEAIEASNLLQDSYILEISSPGISDHLNTDRDFKTFQGFPVRITYKDNANSELQKSGLLKERSIDHVHLNIKGRISRIKREDVLEVRLISPTG